MYEILCLDCYKKYVGATSRSIDKRIFDPIKDFKRANVNNDLVKHNLETNHKYDFKGGKILVHIGEKNKQKHTK